MYRIARALGGISARHPRTTLAAWGAALLLSLLSAAIAGGTFVDDYVAPGSDSAAAVSLLEDRFPEATGGSAHAVFAAEAGASLTPADAEAIDAAVRRLSAVPHVVAVSDPLAPGSMSPDGRIAWAQIVLDVPDHAFGPEGADALLAAVRPTGDAGLQAEVGGDAVFLNSQPETSGAELVGLVVALIVLLSVLGTAVGAVLPIGMALVGVAVGTSLVSVLAGVIDISSDGPTIATMIGLGVGIDYALFLVARYRDERASGLDDRTALERALASSGSAVVFAGITVVIAMAGLALTGLGVLGSMGLSASLVVLVSVIGALTLLPAVLTLLGGRIDRGRVRRRPPPADASATTWWRFAHHVSARPWRYLIASAALLGVLAAPTTAMEFGLPDAGSEPPSTTHRRAYDLLAEGFGAGVNGPLLVVIDTTAGGAAGPQLVATAEQVLRADPGIAAVAGGPTSPDGSTVVLQAVPTTGPSAPETGATIDRLRAALPEGVHVAGVTAAIGDVTDQLTATLPMFIGAILIGSFVLLVLVFRSIAVPLKAALMNLLAIGAAYGVMVAVFQWGWLRQVVGLEAPVPIISFVPVLMFAVLFGLSMDYEVFLLSRIREEQRLTGDDVESVARGLAATGRVITSAALIMISVFASFVLNPSPILKMVGLGLAVAIALDATVVRSVLVPSTMALMGRANWWLPSWLDRLLPHLDVERPMDAPPPTSTDRVLADV